MSGMLTVVIQQQEQRFTWTAHDRSGEVCSASFSRSELRQVKRDLETLLGCELEAHRGPNGRIIGYFSIGRAHNLTVEVKR